MKTRTSNKSTPKDPWLRFVFAFMLIAAITVIGTTWVDPDTGLNLSLNITSEALGTIASLLFIQRFVDNASRIETEKTTKMIKNNFGKIKKLINEIDNRDKVQIDRGKKRYSSLGYSRRNRKRVNMKRKGAADFPK